MGLQHQIRVSMYVVSIIAILVLSIVGPTIPANAELTKRGSFLNDQHLTALYGNTKVCGDHMCGPGEWVQLQENLTNAQFRTIGKNQTHITPPSNVTTTQPTMTPPSNVTTTQPTMTPPSNVTTTQPTMTPPSNVTTTQPTMTPPPQSTVCIAVKSVLALANVPSGVVAKVMADLGCS